MGKFAYALAIVSACVSTTTHALDFGDFIYTNNGNNTVTITGFTGTNTHINIPSLINGYSVVAIGPIAPAVKY